MSKVKIEDFLVYCTCDFVALNAERTSSNEPMPQMSRQGSGYLAYHVFFVSMDVLILEYLSLGNSGKTAGGRGRPDSTEEAPEAPSSFIPSALIRWNSDRSVPNIPRPVISRVQAMFTAQHLSHSSQEATVYWYQVPR